jgi:hypothetical protein
LGTVAPELEGLSVKKQHLLLQQSKRQREQMCPKSNTAYKVCKIVSVDLTALSSAKLRILLPVLPSTDALPKILASDKSSHSSKKLKKFADNKSNNVSNIFNRTAPISVNDGVYGYKSIVLKKITEEGLKDVIKNGSKSKETATITYKYKNKPVVFVVRNGKIFGSLEDPTLGRFFLRPCPYNKNCYVLVQKRAV